MPDVAATAGEITMKHVTLHSPALLWTNNKVGYKTIKFDTRGQGGHALPNFKFRPK
jgi:hypothetical protein